MNFIGEIFIFFFQQEFISQRISCFLNLRNAIGAQKVEIEKKNISFYIHIRFLYYSSAVIHYIIFIATEK